jgi:hypothetical protein
MVNQVFLWKRAQSIGPYCAQFCFPLPQLHHYLYPSKKFADDNFKIRWNKSFPESIHGKQNNHHQMDERICFESQED